MQSIYAHHVLHGTGTFDEVPPSVEEMAERFHKVVEQRLGLAGRRRRLRRPGLGYYTQFRDRSAYRFTVEDSIYVRDDVRGQGVGKALVRQLIDDATARGFRQMIAVIGDSANVGSIGVHASLGFHMVGTMRSRRDQVRPLAGRGHDAARPRARHGRHTGPVTAGRLRSARWCRVAGSCDEDRT